MWCISDVFISGSFSSPLASPDGYFIHWVWLVEQEDGGCSRWDQGIEVGACWGADWGADSAEGESAWSNMSDRPPPPPPYLLSSCLQIIQKRQSASSTFLLHHSLRRKTEARMSSEDTEMWNRPHFETHSWINIESCSRFRRKLWCDASEQVVKQVADYGHC